jgi:hypothetical protein
MKPLPIDEHRLERIMREVDAHEEVCRLGVDRCSTCAELYRRTARALETALANAKAMA